MRPVTGFKTVHTTGASGIPYFRGFDYLITTSNMGIKEFHLLECPSCLVTHLLSHDSQGRRNGPQPQLVVQTEE